MVGVQQLRSRLATWLGRTARAAMRLRGGGSAVPGRVALAIDPGYLRRAVEQLPLGVVVVSGSNGKSTTTHFLTTILRGHGLRVFTNSSGGNLPQGIASSLLPDVDGRGRLRADIAVLEVDEAFGPRLLPHLHPRGALLLNVQVDQLNRFYDPNRVAGFLATIAQACGDFVVLNADDDSLRALGAALTAPVDWFGVAPQLVRDSPNGLSNFEQLGGAAAPVPAAERAVQVTGTRLQDDGGPSASILIRTGSAGDAAGRAPAPTAREQEVRLPARGLHYAIDAAGAAATAARILGDRFRPALLSEALAAAGTVYGRGEVLTHRGEELEIVMMKNPPSLQLNLDALPEPPEQVLVAVDEGTPDPSWIYGSDLSKLDHVDVVAGTKAWQIATRLEYGGIPVATVEPSTGAALDAFLRLPRPGRGRKLLIVNYEEMMAIRRRLGASGIEGKANV